MTVLDHCADVSLSLQRSVQRPYSAIASTYGITELMWVDNVTYSTAVSETFYRTRTANEFQTLAEDRFSSYVENVSLQFVFAAWTFED